MMFLTAAVLLVGLAVTNAEKLCKKSFEGPAAKISQLCNYFSMDNLTLEAIAECKDRYTLHMMDAVKKCAEEKEFKGKNYDTKAGLVKGFCGGDEKEATKIGCCIMTQEALGTQYEDSPEMVGKVCQRCVTDPNSKP